jgi:2-polyprenyl-6-methoxyphenol hydroxylase-like FAD-dependent oxidoreductase
MAVPQVLVVGAGPVGLTLAAELVRHGVAVRIVDAAATRSDKSRALVLWPRTLELLDAARAADPFVAAGLKITQGRLFNRSLPLATIPLDAIDSAYRYALFIPQDETERLLEEHLQRLGVTVQRQVRLAGFVQDEDGVTATLQHGEDGTGRSESLRTEWLIGCDGAHSTVRHALDLPFSGKTEPSDWLLADVHVVGMQGPPAMRLHLHDEGVLVFFPMAGNRYRVVADLGPATGERPPPPTLADVQTLLDRRGPGGLRPRDPVWLNNFRINERKVVDYRAGRVFLAGDAAHIHSPAGGQGMNTGMQDAVNLAWKLALVCREEATDGVLLDSYSVERSAVGEQVLRMAGLMTRAATLRNPIARAVRNTIVRLALRLDPLRRRFAARLSETDIRYARSPLNRIAKGVPAFGARLRPGDRVPDCPAVDLDGRASRLERLLRAGRFVVLDVAETRDAPHALATLANTLGPQARLCVVGTLAPSDVPWATRGARYVIRPDGYLAFIGRSGADAALGDWFRVILGR